jgi:hypothetical protein
MGGLASVQPMTAAASDGRDPRPGTIPDDASEGGA